MAHLRNVFGGINYARIFAFRVGAWDLTRRKVGGGVGWGLSVPQNLMRVEEVRGTHGKGYEDECCRFV